MISKIGKMLHPIAEHYKRDFDMIFHLKTGQKLIAEHYERDF